MTQNQSPLSICRSQQFEVSLSTVRRPVISSATFDPGAQDVAFTTESGKVHIYRIQSNSTEPISLERIHPTTWLTTANGILAICHENLEEPCIWSVRNVQTQLGTIQFDSRLKHFTVCALSADARFLGLICEHTRCAVVYDRYNLAIRPKIWRNSSYENISFSPDGSTTFLLTQNKFDAFHTENQHHCAELPVQRTARPDLIQLASDETTENVAVTDGKQLRVWNVRNREESIRLLNGYDPPNPSLSKIGTCAISRDGSRVVAATSTEKIRLWDTTTCSQIATLQMNHHTIFACVFEPNGTSTPSTVLTASKESEKKNLVIRKWELPVDNQGQSATGSSHSHNAVGEPIQSNRISTIAPAYSKPKGSPLTNAFAEILSNPSVLDEGFIETHFSAENVRSVSDVLAGHNIIVLAIRAGVQMSRNTYIRGGPNRMLQENLYMPATKLQGECSCVLDEIFYHAREERILEDAATYVLNMRVQNRLEALRRALGTFAIGIQDLYARSNHLESGQQNIRNSVFGLSRALKQLHNSINTRNRLGRYVAVAGILLSLIPTVGQILSGGVGVVAALAGDRLEDDRYVDMTNVEAAHDAFSLTLQDTVSLDIKQMVLDSLRNSGFASLDEVKQELNR